MHLKVSIHSDGRVDVHIAPAVRLVCIRITAESQTSASGYIFRTFAAFFEGIQNIPQIFFGPSG